MSDQELMRSIHSLWNADIDAAVSGGPIPPALIGALIANESGGDAQARRFEKDTFAILSLVVTGRKSVFQPAGIRQPLGASDILQYINPAAQTDTAWMNFTANLRRLQNLATSHGLTQIMGWHWIEFGRNFLSPDWTPKQQLEFTVLLLTWFANKYTLDVTRDHEQLLHCWNTGDPGKQTFDPNYVAKGLARMLVYSQIE